MLFINNKYQKWYYQIIKTAKTRTLLNSIYSEKHHIIPRSFDGNNSADNLVRLTAREHFICHILLTKFTEGQARNKMINAVIMMKMANSGQLRYINSRLYETARIEYSKIASEKNQGAGNPFYNKTHTDECKERMSKKKKGVYVPWNQGLAGSEKTKEIGKVISIIKKGLRWWTNGIIEIHAKDCPSEGWHIGRAPNLNFACTDKRRQSMREKRSGGTMNWWNDGKINKRAIECPGKEWKRGRIMSASHLNKIKFKSQRLKT